MAAGAATMEMAEGMTIGTNEDYGRAGEFLTEIKRRAKQVTEYWKPAKEKAWAAHKEIAAKEKAMLGPLEQAEKAVKSEMARYLQEVERARLAAEAEAKRRAQEERDRLLTEALAAEQRGDEMGAHVGMAMAEMVEDMAPTAMLNEAAPVAAGVSVRKSWKARVVDEAAVPTAFGGVTIRPVDVAALNGLARMTKGTAQIPGVEMYEDAAIAARV